MSTQQKIMFEIYRNTDAPGSYCVVYYTELSPRNRDFMINQALAGESVFDGYFQGAVREAAGREVEAILLELNGGRDLDRESIRARLMPYLVA